MGTKIGARIFYTEDAFSKKVSYVLKEVGRAIKRLQ